MSTGETLGRIAELWRYPVKSMAGERITRADVGERGIAGDRGYALLDPASEAVASAKHPKAWPGLIHCSASYVEEPAADGTPAPVEIKLPDGRTVRSDGESADDALSDFFGRPVELRAQAPAGATYEAWWPEVEGLSAERSGVLRVEEVAMAAPEGTFFDLAQLHVMTTATLAHLTALHSDGQIAVRRFRPNLVVEVDGEARFAEDGWVGRTLAAGGLHLSVLMPTPRCVMTTIQQGELPDDPGVLRTVAAANKYDFDGFGRYACAGVYAAVERGGTTAVGDIVARVETGNDLVASLAESPPFRRV